MRVCWTSDWSGRPVPTGFSRASKAILSYLHARGHEVVEVAIGYTGYGDATPWKTYPTTAYGGRLEGQDIAAGVAHNAKADAMVLFMDVPDLQWALPNYHDKAKQPLTNEQIEALDKRKFALCMYSPVDGCCPNGKPPGTWYDFFGQLRTFDAFAAPSRFGTAMLKEASGRDDTARLPHGVDTRVFRPLDGAPRQMRRMLGIPEDNFTLLYVATNRQRKQIPAFYEIVSKVQDKLPDVKVTAVFIGEDREDWYHLQGIVDIYGIEKKGGEVFRFQRFNDEWLNVGYNAADVLVHPSGAEGFGIPILESQSSRVPALVTSYSAMPEIVPSVEGEWCRIPVKAMIPHPQNGLVYAWPDTDVAADRLVAFWKDRRLRVTLRKAAFELAQQYDWRKVAPKVETWLEQAIARRQEFGTRVMVERVV